MSSISSIPRGALASEEELRKYYIGKSIDEVPTPAAVLDVAIVKRHCHAMLRTVKDLGIGFRAHIKTHKVSYDNHLGDHLISWIGEASTAAETRGATVLISFLDNSAYALASRK